MNGILFIEKDATFLITSTGGAKLFHSSMIDSLARSCNPCAGDYYGTWVSSPNSQVLDQQYFNNYRNEKLACVNFVTSNPPLQVFKFAFLKNKRPNFSRGRNYAIRALVGFLTRNSSNLSRCNLSRWWITVLPRWFFLKINDWWIVRKWLFLLLKARKPRNRPRNGAHSIPRFSALECFSSFLLEKYYETRLRRQLCRGLALVVTTKVPICLSRREPVHFLTLET